MVSDFHQKSFRIKHEDTNFFSNKLVSKQKLDLSIPSFRIYYGDNVPSSVPFIWESQPGTPKHPLSEISHYLPPLTPPPSYYKNNESNEIPTRKNSRSKLFHRLIKKLINPKKPHFPSSSFSSTSWSSSSHSSSFSAPTTPASSRRRRSSSSRGGSYSFDDEVSGKISATTAGGGHQSTAAGVFMMKKALFSVLSGRRSS